jgi:streptogramin lyase
VDYDDGRAIGFASEPKAGVDMRLAPFKKGNWKYYTLADDLPGTQVRGLQLSPEGSLWCGTSAGAARFDGAEFHTYAGEDGPGGNSIWAVHRDAEGVLWFGTFGGVTRFDGSTWSSFTKADGLGGNSVSAIAQAGDGPIWLCTDGGVTRYVRRKAKPKSPKLSVQLDQDYQDLEEVPAITSGRRVRFNFAVVDLKTGAEQRRFRTLIARGRLSQPELEARTDWQPATRLAQHEWRAETAGPHTFAVQYVDRDLNYSAPTFFTMNVAPPWYANARLS